MRSWSLVKMGTTASQKKLFFNLRKVKGQIQALEEGDLRPDQVTEIAKRLGVPEEDVISMNRRLSGDASLNAPVRAESEGEWQDWLVDQTDDQESALVESEEAKLRMELLSEAMHEVAGLLLALHDHRLGRWHTRSPEALSEVDFVGAADHRLGIVDHRHAFLLGAPSEAVGEIVDRRRRPDP